MPNKRSILFALFLLMLLGQATHNAAGQSEQPISITVEAAPWNLTLPRDGLAVHEQRLDPGGRNGYFLLRDRKNQMTLSFFIEPAEKCKSSKECREIVMEEASPSWENPQNLTTGEIGEVSYVEFFMPTFKGEKVQQQHMYAQFVVDGFLIILHISKAQYKPEERVLLLDRIKSIKFEPKKQTVVQSKDTPVEAATKAAEAWLLLWDAGKYHEAYENVTMLQKFMKTSREWYVLWYALRKPLGVVKVRKLDRAQKCADRAGCMVVMFETSFEHNADVRESVMVMLDKDGTWRVFGYLNNTAPL